MALRLSSLIIPLLCRTRIFLSLYDSEVEEECDVGLNRHLVCLRNRLDREPCAPVLCKDHVFAQKLTWYFIGVYVINSFS